jgi:uncharacterized protein YjbI with pentapeptide repeats
MQLLLFDIISRVTRKKLYRLPFKDLKNRDLREIDLTFANLRGCDLSGSDLSGSNLNRADLSGANISGCNLSGCLTLGTRFDGANISGVKGLGVLRTDFWGNPGFYRASWKDCDFSTVDVNIPKDHKIRIPEGFCFNLVNM